MFSLEFTCIFNQRDIIDFVLTIQYMFSLDFMKKCINVSSHHKTGLNAPYFGIFLYFHYLIQHLSPCKKKLMLIKQAVGFICILNA